MACVSAAVKKNVVCMPEWFPSQRFSSRMGLESEDLSQEALSPAPRV